MGPVKTTHKKFIKEVNFYNFIKIITKVDEGFDMRLARQGVWGKGIYFADSSLYSN